MMNDWVRNIWKNRSGVQLKRSAMLVLDVAFEDILFDDVKKELSEGKTDLVVIPGGLTSILQPFKAFLNCSAQQAQNVLTHLQIHFLTERYRIGKPGHGSDLESN